MNKIYRKFFLSEDKVFFDVGIIKKHESQEKLSIRCIFRRHIFLTKFSPL